LPTPKPTLRLPLSLGFVDRIHQFLIFQSVIHHSHPRFPQLGHFLGKQTFPHRWLLVPQLDHSAVLLVLDGVTANTTF